MLGCVEALGGLEALAREVLVVRVAHVLNPSPASNSPPEAPAPNRNSRRLMARAASATRATRRDVVDLLVRVSGSLWVAGWTQPAACRWGGRRTVSRSSPHCRAGFVHRRSPGVPSHHGASRGRCLDPPSAHASGLLEPGLVEGGDPPSEQIDLLVVDIDADGVVAHRCKGEAGHENHMPGCERPRPSSGNLPLA